MLFTSSVNGVYTQNDTDNRFRDTVLDVIYGNSTTGTTGIEKEFGGPTNAQNLVKARGAIFEGDIIDYNGYPYNIDGTINKKQLRNWYQKSYVIGRYKTLTGKNKDIDYIRSSINLEKVLKYYEFMEFKKAEFKCTEVNYDDGGTGESNTGKIIGMDFEIKE